MGVQVLEDSDFGGGMMGLEESIIELQLHEARLALQVRGFLSSDTCRCVFSFPTPTNPVPTNADIARRRRSALHGARCR